MEVGDFCEVMDYFRESLRALMDNLASDETIESATSLSSTSRGFESSPAAKSESPTKYRTMGGTGALISAMIHAAPAALPFVHRNGINLLESPGAYSPDDVVNVTICSSIVIFNMAMLYHLKGIDTADTWTPTRLVKARSLYRKCLGLLNDVGVPLYATGNPMIDILTMCLFNNMAQCSYELRLYAESRQMFDELVRFSLTITPLVYQNESVSCLLEQHKAGFLLNAVILKIPDNAPAA